ncbi:MAG: AmmeMemoRadiSam system protein A [Verrucomicrobiota bacterium]
MTHEQHPVVVLTREEETTLLKLARRSMEHGLQFRRPLEVNPAEYPAALRAPKAVFVTLHLGANLRGCIGTLEANRSLVENVAQHAYYSAMTDSRFTPLTWAELEAVKIQISVLSEAVPMNFTSEEDLLAQIRPGIDGLVLEDWSHRGTFLPAVWEDLPEKREFWRQLKRKAGLAPDYWSKELKVSRYVAHCFGEPPA